MTQQQARAPVAPQQARPQAGNGVERGGAQVRLTRAIETIDGPVTTLTLREPTFGDWLDCGELNSAVAVTDGAGGQPGRIEIQTNREAVMRWLARLSGLDQAVLTQLTMTDFRQAHLALQRIVGDMEGNSASAPTSSGSSAASRQQRSSG